MLIFIHTIHDARNTFYRGADKSLSRPTSRCILFDGENISFDASLVIQGYYKRNTHFQRYVVSKPLAQWTHNLRSSVEER
jgi:hypothetical protein